MMLEVYSVGITLYALSLAIMAVAGTIRRIGVLFAAMEAAVVFLALLTKRVEAFALAGLPAVLVLLFCISDKYRAGKRVCCGERQKKLSNDRVDQLPWKE